MRFLTVLSLIVATLPFTAAAAECPRVEGVTDGIAEFIGEPWDYTWVVDQAWDNEKGEWVEINPITHSLPVPGEAILFRFEDGAEFTYGDKMDYHPKGDNLHTIYRGQGDTGPYRAIRTAEGEIYLLHADCVSSGWNLAR